MSTADIHEISKSTFYYFDGTPYLKVKDSAFGLSQESLDTLLNTLKIPIKYLHRLAQENEELACASVNCWLEKSENIGALVKGEVVDRIFDSRRLFVPFSMVRSNIAEYLNSSSVIEDGIDGINIGVFSTSGSDIELANGDKAFLSFRIMFSECFAMVPKIDAVLTVRGSYENYYFPVEGRKFRVANCGPSQIIFQIIEFIDILTADVEKVFIPRLNAMIEADAHLNVAAFIGRLCSELRISRRIGQYLMTGIEESEVALHELVRKVSNNLLPEVRPDYLSLDTTREIEIALSRAITKNSFK